MLPATRALLAVLACMTLAACSDDPSGLLQVNGVGAATGTAAGPEPLPSPGDLAWVVRAARWTLASSADVAGTVDLTGQGTRIDLGPLPQSLRFTGRYHFRRAEGTLSVGVNSAETGTIQEIFTASTVYVSNLPELPPNVWGAARRSALTAHYLYRAPANDPKVLVELVAGAEEMARTGQELIGTTPAVHFRGYVTTESLLAHCGPQTSAQLQQLLLVLGPQARRMEVWTSLQGQLLQLRLGFTARQGSQKVSETVQLDLAHPGVKVKVVAPPKARTKPVAALPGFLFG